MRRANLDIHSSRIECVALYILISVILASYPQPSLDNHVAICCTDVKVVTLIAGIYIAPAPAYLSSLNATTTLTAY